MLSTYFSKFLIISASTVSALGLLVSVPQAASAQEMSEDMDETMEVMESNEMETQMGQNVEMDNADIENDGMMMDSDDVDSDYDNDGDDDDMDVESTPSYSNSPRALW